MLGLASSEGLGSTVWSNGRMFSVPPGQLTLVKKNEGKPLRADQAGLPRLCLPPRTKLNEAAALRTAAGFKH